MPDLNRLELTKVSAGQRKFVDGATSEAILPRGVQSPPTTRAATAMELDEDVRIGVGTPQITRVHEDSVCEFIWRTSTIVHLPSIGRCLGI